MDNDIDVIRGYLAAAIGNIEFNLAQHEEGTPWTWPGTREETVERLKGYKDALRNLDKTAAPA